MKLKIKKLVLMVAVLAGVLLGAWKYLPATDFRAEADDSRTFEVLEPESWVGGKLPILDNIDIGDLLKDGRWLVLFYHYDCGDCVEVIDGWADNAGWLTGCANMMAIEVPPYGSAGVDAGEMVHRGRVDESREWFVSTPAMIFVEDGVVKFYSQRINEVFDYLKGGGGV